MDREPNTSHYPLWQAAMSATGRGFGLQGEVLEWQAQAEGHGRTSARIQLRLGAWQQDFFAEMKIGLRPQTLSLVQQQLATHGEKALLIADHVTPPMAEWLRAHDIRFIDAAGNAYLHNPPLYVWVKGERPIAQVAAARGGSRAFTPSGLQVILALLCRPGAAENTYRHLATLAGVAHGTVGWVMPELQALGFISTISGKRRLLNVEVLLDRWAEAYLRTLRPRLLLGHYWTDDLADWKDAQIGKYHVTLGGEAAAARLTGQLRPGRITLYASRTDPRLQVDFRLRKAEPGNIEVLRKFWAIDPDAEIAPLPVVYADLIGTGDARCFEAARMIKEQFLA